MTQALKDQVAIIMGASSGMGQATARRLAAAGSHVVIAARDGEKLRELRSEMGGRTLAGTIDVHNRTDVEGLVQQTIDEFQRVDLMVYATGTNIPERSLEVLSHETWDMMLATNLTGAFNCTKAVLPVMRHQQQGLIIYISTAAIQAPDASGVSYQASKHGLTGLAHGAFIEEKDNGIRTSVIYPGLTDTPLVLKRPVPTPQETLDLALQPEDVAAACVFIASLPTRARVAELVLTPSRL